MGTDGKGTANHFGVSKKIDVYISSLSKGLGSFGGYVASKKNIIELCINKSKSFIYTSALPRILIDDATKRFESNREKNRKKLWRNVKKFSDGLKEIGFNDTATTEIYTLSLHDALPILMMAKAQQIILVFQKKLMSILAV